MRQIDQDTVNKFVLAFDGLSQDTQKKYMQTLLAFLHFAVKKRCLDPRQLQTVDLPRFKTRARNQIISPNDWDILLKYAKKTDTDLYMYLLTLYNCVGRPNEIAKLRVSDFDLERRYADIYMMKTSKIKRVYLRSEFCTVLDEYIAQNVSGSELFAGFNRQSNYYSRKFRMLRDKLNLNKQYNLYSIRHTAITDLVNITHDVEFVARQAGNDPLITMKHYINRSDEHYLAVLDGEQPL